MRKATTAMAVGLVLTAAGPAAAQGPQAPKAQPAQQAVQAQPAAKGQPAAQGQQSSRDRVVVRFNGQEVRSGAMLQLIQAQNEESRRQLKDKPEVLQNLLRNEALRKATLASARKEGFDGKPEIKYMMERIAEQALLERYLDQKAAPEPGYPGAAEIEAAYQANRASFLKPARARLAQILVRVAPDAPKAEADKAEARAKEAATKAAAAGADFAALAKTYSEDTPSNQNGGEVGWLDMPGLMDDVRAAIAGLPVGGVSKPVKTRFGWQIVKVLEREEESVRPLDEVSPALANALRRKKAEENRQKWLANLQAGGTPTIDEKGLADLRKKLE